MTLLRDCWYLALLGRRLKRGRMVAKTMLGEPVVRWSAASAGQVRSPKLSAFDRTVDFRILHFPLPILIAPWPMGSRGHHATSAPTSFQERRSLTTTPSPHAPRRQRFCSLKSPMLCPAAPGADAPLPTMFAASARLLLIVEKLSSCEENSDFGLNHIRVMRAGQLDGCKSL